MINKDFFSKLESFVEHNNEIDIVYVAEKMQYCLYFNKEIAFIFDDYSYKAFYLKKSISDDEYKKLKYIDSFLYHNFGWRVSMGNVENQPFSHSINGTAVSTVVIDDAINKDKSEADVKYDPKKGWNFKEHNKKSDESEDDLFDSFAFEDLPF